MVLLSCPAIALALGGLRLARAARSRQPRRAVLVGPKAEAERLRTLLTEHPTPAFELIGFVDRNGKRRPTPQPDTFRLGSYNQLRDLVRLRRVDDVIFAGMGLSNEAIFSLMQELNGLPIQFKILAEGRQHVIGKASVEQLAFPALVEADEALGGSRGPAARRTFEVAAALAGLALYPLIGLLAWARGKSGLIRLLTRLRRMPEVLAGRVALIGYPEGERPPHGVPGLRPGVFAVTDSLPTAQPGTREVENAYLYYAANQSVSFDLDILLQSTRNLLR